MHISKVAKGLIAGGLGLALLIGGGTFALWSDSATVDAGTINSGTLDIDTDSSTTEWYLNGATEPLTESQLDNLLIVPGDTLKMTTDLSVTADGNGLNAELSVNPASMTVPEGGESELLTILQDPDNMELTVKNGATDLETVPGKDNTFKVTTSTSEQTLSATLTITLPANTTVDQVAQGETVNLDALTFILEQVAS